MHIPFLPWFRSLPTACLLLCVPGLAALCRVQDSLPGCAACWSMMAVTFSDILGGLFVFFTAAFQGKGFTFLFEIESVGGGIFQDWGKKQQLGIWLSLHDTRILFLYWNKRKNALLLSSCESPAPGVWWAQLCSWAVNCSNVISLEYKWFWSKMLLLIPSERKEFITLNSVCLNTFSLELWLFYVSALGWKALAVQCCHIAWLSWHIA